MSARRKGISLPQLSILKSSFDLTVNTAGQKKTATGEAGRPKEIAMLDIAQTTGKRHDVPEYQQADVRIDPAAEGRRASAFLTGKLIASRKLAPGEMHSEVFTISPALALLILSQHNVGNRPVRQSRVDEFVKIIGEGRWKLSSQGISFARNGALNNGQHRLNAIVQSGQGVAMYVTFGEERDVFDVLDTGAVRGGQDTLSIQGFKNASTLAASAKFLVLVQNNRVFNPPKVHNDEILGIVRQNPRLDDATGPGHAIGVKLRCSSAATTVAFYRIMVMSRQSERLDQFLSFLRDGNLPDARDPILVLRDGLMSKKLDAHIRTGGVKTFAQYAAIVNAWNKHIRGRKGSIRWEHPEPLPSPE